MRNNGTLSTRAQKRDAAGWKLTIDGEVEKPLEISLDELEKMPSVTQAVVLECAGNGRAFFDPPVRGNQWTYGAVACSSWTGVALKDILARAGVKASARYTGHYGDDAPLGQAEPFSRGIPIEKALDGHTLVATRMNGEPLSALNGFPARLLVPGWIASCSQKWLTRIWVRDREHDAEKMRGYSYRVPAHPVAPGARPPESDMVVVTSLVVKSMITRPAAGARVPAAEKLKVAGHAWAGERKVARVALSTDYGITWADARLAPPSARYAWARFEAEVAFPRKGYYEVWARAFDDAGDAQPFRQPWNPKGYLSNVIHRVPVDVA